MKRRLIQMAFVLLCGQAYGQKDVAVKALEKYKIDESVLDDKNRQQPDDHSYDLKETVATEGKEMVVMAHYDASKAEEDRWTVISANDQDPSTADIRRFKKEHGKSPAPPVKADESSYKIDKEDANNLVISYLLDPASLTEDNMFLKDCRNFLTFDLKTAKLTKVESVNEKPLKVKTFNVSRLNSYSELLWNESEKKYFPKKTTIAMDLKLLGQQLMTTTILEYSNFTK